MSLFAFSQYQSEYTETSIKFRARRRRRRSKNSKQFLHLPGKFSSCSIWCTPNPFFNTNSDLGCRTPYGLHVNVHKIEYLAKNCNKYRVFAHSFKMFAWCVVRPVYVFQRDCQFAMTFRRENDKFIHRIHNDGEQKQKKALHKFHNVIHNDLDRSHR